MPKRNRRSRSYPANHLLVYEALENAGKPVSAYDLLAKLRDKGVTAPPTVYRALKRLMKEGRVHRIESLNAYVICTAGHSHQGKAGFAICDDCGSVVEFSYDEIKIPAKAWASNMCFTMRDVSIELHGQCAVCTQSAATAFRIREKTS
ncbi:Fur family transcriptional regulator [Magnetococcales bacterium HHB-1]